MKSVFFKLAAAALLVTAFSHSAVADDEAPVSKDVIVSLNDVYVPGGFDSTADAYVVANGLFPNGCYKWKGAEVTNVDSYNHEIRSMASVSQGMCIMVLMPFTKEIRLGKLASGSHSLKFVSGDGTFLLKTLKVE
jgi:hypothetical protein